MLANFFRETTKKSIEFGNHKFVALLRHDIWAHICATMWGNFLRLISIELNDGISSNITPFALSHFHERKDKICIWTIYKTGKTIYVHSTHKGFEIMRI